MSLHSKLLCDAFCSVKKPLLSRGSLLELTPKNWIADGRDAWACDGCRTVYFEDREDMLLDHPTNKGEMLCFKCAKDWLNDNPISPANVSSECALRCELMGGERGLNGNLPR